MREIDADIFNYIPEVDKRILRCVTTNGVVNKNGFLVMGAGVAYEAKRRYPELPYLFGQAVDERGNHVHIIEKFGIASLPTKHHWKNKSDINLISRSCMEIASFTKSWDYVLLTRPGCGLGGLNWEDVKKIIAPILNKDKFIIVHR